MIILAYSVILFLLESKSLLLRIKCLSYSASQFIKHFIFPFLCVLEFLQKLAFDLFHLLNVFLSSFNIRNFLLQPLLLLLLNALDYLSPSFFNLLINLLLLNFYLVFFHLILPLILMLQLLFQV